MTPVAFLSLMILLTAGMALGWRVALARRHRLLGHAAERWQLRYCPEDQFRLADRLADSLPLPGAADVHVSDVMYCANDACHCYVFTIECTVGLVRSKERKRCVARLIEPRAIGSADARVEIAPEDQSLLDQYRHFAEMTLMAGGDGS